MRKPRLILADHHPLFLVGLRTILESEFEIAGTAFDGRTLVRLVTDAKPDAIVLEIGMAELNGIEVSRQLKTSAPGTKVVFVTQRDDREFVRAAFQAGASAYVLKRATPAEVIHAVKEALAGRFYVFPGLCDGVAAGQLFENPQDLFGEGLTRRQRELLQLIAEGKTGKEIAHSLCISIKTVEFHKAGLTQRLGLRSTAELTRYAVSQKMI